MSTQFFVVEKSVQCVRNLFMICLVSFRMASMPKKNIFTVFVFFLRDVAKYIKLSPTYYLNLFSIINIPNITNSLSTQWFSLFLHSTLVILMCNNVWKFKLLKKNYCVRCNQHPFTQWKLWINAFDDRRQN